MASKERVAMLKGLFAACLYGFISISITFFNKAVLASYDFKYPNIMTLFQMLCSLVLLEVMRLTGRIHYATFNTKTAVKTAPLAVSFVGMVLTGLAALKYLNIPMFNALRRVTTLFTMIGEYYLVGTRESLRVQFSVLAMVGGAIVAGVSDLEYTFIGYSLVALNCVFTAGYLLYIAKFGKQGLNTWGLMYYNNILSLPVVILICYANNDFAEVRQYPLLLDTGFVLCFIFQSALAFLLNYSIFLCTNVNSALATSVTGQIKNIATTAVGFVTFQTATSQYTPTNIFGIVLGVWSSSYYSWLKFKESEQKQKKEAVLPTTIDRNEKAVELNASSRNGISPEPVDDIDAAERGRLLPSSSSTNGMSNGAASSRPNAVPAAYQPMRTSPIQHTGFVQRNQGIIDTIPAPYNSTKTI